MEKEAWRAVIQLNLVRSINTVVDAVLRELDAGSGLPDIDEDAVPISPDLEFDSASILSVQRSTSQLGSFPLGDTHRELIKQLEPLRAVQRDLEKKLGSGASEEDDPSYASDSSLDTATKTLPSSPPAPAPRATGLRARRSQEFAVRSHGWKNALQRLRPRLSISSRLDMDPSDTASAVVAAARDAMKALWADAVVRDVVRERGIRLPDSAEL